MAKRILLAEGNQQLAAAIGERLKQQGLDVEYANDGIAALRAIAAEPPDLLLLELKLPGLHGIELIKKLRQSPRSGKLPVIVMTGFYKGEKFQNAAKALGIHHYLEKPLKPSALTSAVQQTLSPATSTPALSTGEARPFAQQLRTAFLKHFSGLLTLQYPDTVRMLLTGFAEVDTVVKAVNEGHIYRFLAKPCSASTLNRSRSRCRSTGYKTSSCLSGCR